MRVTIYNHAIEEFVNDWIKWQGKIRRLREKEAVIEEDLTCL